MSTRDTVLFLVVVSFFLMMPARVQTEQQNKPELTYAQMIDLELLNLERNLKGDCDQRTKLIEKSISKIQNVISAHANDFIQAGRPSKNNSVRTQNRFTNNFLSVENRKIQNLKKQLSECFQVKTAGLGL